jgi:pimeloyl-ACP methyl ester carboxylesterase
MLCEMTSRRRVIAGVAAAGLGPLLAPCASRAQQPHTEISYQSGGLRIQGYFYQPAGSGPFPTLIYNHGSRAGFEWRSIPWVQLAGPNVAAGYAVLVPERRGYGRSDGPAWSEAVGRDVGSVLIAFAG